MIRKVHIEGYRAILNATVQFEPLTALVGPNSSGKSSILSAIYAIDGRIEQADFWRREAPLVLIQANLDDGTQWQLRWIANTDHFKRSHAKAPVNVQRVSLDPGVVGREIQLRTEVALNATGANVANVFSTLDRNAQSRIADQFCRWVDCFSDVRTLPSQNGCHRVVFRDRWSSVEFEPTEVSEGTLLIFALLVLQAQRPAPDVLLVEEPERGFHPYLLGKVVDMYRGLSKGEFGKPVQVVLATQSPEVLNHLEPNEVRFLSRDADGNVTVQEAPVDEPRWTKVYDEYQEAMGALWLSGGLGGVPGV